MRLLVLAPSYGTRTLIANSLALFRDQELLDCEFARMLVFADDGLVQPFQRLKWDGRDAVIVGSDKHIPLTYKYNAMLMMDHAIGFDAVVVWDVDDVYLPWYLAEHDFALRRFHWSHPSQAYSDYKVDLDKQPPHPKSLNHTHYHGALALRTSLCKTLGGWPVTEHSDYDKQMLAACRKAVGRPHDQSARKGASYVYRWSNSGFSHISARIKDRKYPTPQIHEEPSMKNIIPAYDANTLKILKWLT